MNQEHISHQKQIQTFGDIVAEDNARVIIKQVNTTYQFIHRKDIQERNLVEASPYVGLKKFETKDRDLFFGRELWISKLIEKIGTSHLILLLGASGSGKSSLIRAGLIPKLTQLLRNPFISLILTPDRNPFESFRATLISQGYSQEATETLLECKGNSFTNTVKNLKTIEEQWLIYIDQFEELFTQCKNTEIQKKFIQNITQITQKEENSIKIIIAMRADFLDRLSSSHPSLTKNPLFLHDMQPDELRLAIEQPAAKHGVVFEEGLIQQIINDVQGQARLQPGSLPLLQYTLDLLWQRSTKDISNHRILRKETYQVGGTVRDTLQKRVEEIYTNFTSDEKTATKQIFVKLVDPENTEKLSNLSSPAISRRAFLSEFTNELQQKTLKKLVDKNLLVTNQLNHQTQPTVEIAHEILINSWSTLKGWINERREVIILRNRLADDAQRWHDLYVQHQMLKAEDELWGGSKLERIVEFKQEQQLNSLFGGFSQEQENFFKASLEKRNRVRRKEARDKLLRSIGIGTIVLAGIATASAFLFANSQQNTNKSLQLANASATNLTLDPTRSLWLAIAAYIIKDTPQSYLAIGNALQVNYERVQLVGHTDKVLYAEFDPNNSQRVLTVSSDRTARVWDLSDPSNPIILEGHGGTVQYGHFDPHNPDRVLTVSFDSNAYIWNLKKPNKPQIILEGHTAPINYGEFDPNNPNRILTASSDATAKIWDIDKPNNSLTLKGHEGDVWFAQFDPNDSNRVLTVSRDSTARIWNLEKTTAPLVLKDHTGEIIYGSFDPKNSNRVLTVSNDKTARVWNLNQSSKPIVLKGHLDTVWYGDFNPRNSNKVLTVSDDGTARLWDTKNPQDSRIFRGHQGSITQGKFHPIEANLMLTVGSDNTAKIWDIRKSTPLVELRGHTDKIAWGAFDPQSPNRILTVSDDSTVRVWNIKNSIFSSIPMSQDKNIYSIANGTFDTNNDSRIVSINRNGEIKNWDLENPQNVITTSIKAGSIRDAWFSSNNSNQGVTISDDRDFYLWNLEKSNQPLQLPKGEGDIHEVRFDPNNENRLLRINSNNTATILEIVEGIPKTQIELPSLNPISEGVFNPHDRNQVITASTDGQLQIWKIDESTRPMKPLIEFSVSQQEIWRIKFDPNNSERILTVGNDKIARIWNLETRSVIAELSGHQNTILDGSFDPHNYNRLLTVSSDGTARLWHLKIPSNPLIFREENKVIHGSFDTMGKKILTVNVNGTMRVYYIRDMDLLNLAWRNLSRCLSKQEIDSYDLIRLDLVKLLTQKLNNSNYNIDQPADKLYCRLPKNNQNEKQTELLSHIRLFR